MQLKEIEVTNFRSCKIVKIDFESLTIFIGENDSGKSSILDVFDIAFNNNNPQPNDFYCNKDNNRSEKIKIDLFFLLDDNDTVLTEYAIGRELRIRKEFCLTGEQNTLIYVDAPENENFNIDFQARDASFQKGFLVGFLPELQPNEISNSSKREALFKDLRDSQPKIKSWRIVGNIFGKNFVLYERYSSMDYSDPASIVGKTFRQVFEKSIHKESTKRDGISELIPQLKTVEKKARIDISNKVAELQDFVKKYCENVINIDYQPAFDFSSGIKQGEFYLDRGYGLFPLSRIGDGTKRRLFMAVTDWDREILSRPNKEFVHTSLIIRGYDEPDTNLHYEAQRLMFYSISQIAKPQETGIQVVLCTHSLTMIDRAPAQSIRLFNLDNCGCTNVKKLVTNDDPKVESFLKEIAAELGITNSIMFYERCFIIIEGPTEFNALPMLYKKIYKRSMIEDGIRLINVQSNSSVHSFLKLFSQNKSELLIVFIDRDSENRKDLRLTAPMLREVGFDDTFINEKIKYFGDMEFEDGFSDEVLAMALNLYWPKKDETAWIPKEIEKLRDSKKFSEDIKHIVWDFSKPDSNKWSKPEFGKALAEICPLDQIPVGITELFRLAQSIVGL